MISTLREYLVAGLVSLVLGCSSKEPPGDLNSCQYITSTSFVGRFKARIDIYHENARRSFFSKDPDSKTCELTVEGLRRNRFGLSKYVDDGCDGTIDRVFTEVRDKPRSSATMSDFELYSSVRADAPCSYEALDRRYRARACNNAGEFCD